jgi:hypothetical protein
MELASLRALVRSASPGGASCLRESRAANMAAVHL